jgi:hypothetical protein
MRSLERLACGEETLYIREMSAAEKGETAFWTI